MQSFFKGELAELALRLEYLPQLSEEALDGSLSPEIPDNLFSWISKAGITGLIIVSSIALLGIILFSITSLCAGIL